MDLEIIIPSEVNQRKTNVIGYHLHVEILSNTKELFFTGQKQTHRPWKQTFATKGERLGGGMN